MKKILLVALLLLIPIAIAEDYSNVKDLFVKITISSEATINPTRDNYNIEHLIVNLSFFPQDSFNQHVSRLSTIPPSAIEDTILFKWESPAEKQLKFTVNADVKTNNDYIKVTDKVKFPIKELLDELEIYTRPSATVDSDNKEIIRLASVLAEGEDDLYQVAFKLAEWTKNNVKYDLSTLTASVSQKASWVLRNREGVCDELTNLFIAMARSLGIPAKFVSGIAYTNSPLFEEEWGPHGWAEIYFPGYGWIPFDVTYGEFGFIDPGHIKSKEALDADEPSTKYQWLGSNIDVETEKLDIRAEVQEATGSMAPLISLDANVAKDSAGFGSYNLVEVRVDNLKNFYVSTELYISKPNEVEVVGSDKKEVLLKPLEKKSIYWVIKLTEGMNRNYIYTLPIGVSSLRGITSNSSFKSTADSQIFSLEQVNEILEQKKEEEIKTYSKNINISCDISKREFYQYEDAEIRCAVKNTGNVFLEKLNACLEECDEFDLGIAQEKIINFSVNKSIVGNREEVIKAFNEQVSRASYVRFILLDAPEIGIADLEYPEYVSFDDEYSISFVMDKKSWSAPEDIVVDLKQNGFSRKWEIDRLAKNEKFTVNLKGNDLDMENRFEILIDYEGNDGKEYRAEKEFFIRLNKVSFPQRMQIFLNKIAKSFTGLLR